MCHFEELPIEKQREFAASMGEFYLEGLKRKNSMIIASIIEAWDDRNRRDEIHSARDAWNERSDLA